MTVAVRSASARMRARRLLALRADLGRLPLALGLHALVDRLAVRLRQIGAADLHVDHLDAEASRLAVDLLGDPRHQLGALVADELDEARVAEHPAHRRVEDDRQPRVGDLRRCRPTGRSSSGSTIL